MIKMSHQCLLRLCWCLLKRQKPGLLFVSKILLKRLQKWKDADVPKSGGREMGEREEPVALLCRGSRWARNSISEQDGRGGWWWKRDELGRLSWRPGSVTRQAFPFIELLLCAKYSTRYLKHNTQWKRQFLEQAVWPWSCHCPSLNLSIFFWKVTVIIHNPQGGGGTY